MDEEIWYINRYGPEKFIEKYGVDAFKEIFGIDEFDRDIKLSTEEEELFDKNIYQEFGVEEGADEKAVKKRWRQVIKEYHPESAINRQKSQEDKLVLQDQFKYLSTIKVILTDSRKREMYESQRGDEGLEEIVLDTREWQVELKEISQGDKTVVNNKVDELKSILENLFDGEELDVQEDDGEVWIPANIETILSYWSKNYGLNFNGKRVLNSLLNENIKEITDLLGRDDEFYLPDLEAEIQRLVLKNNYSKINLSEGIVMSSPEEVIEATYLYGREIYSKSKIERVFTEIDPGRCAFLRKKGPYLYKMDKNQEQVMNMSDLYDLKHKGSQIFTIWNEDDTDERVYVIAKSEKPRADRGEIVYAVGGRNCCVA